LSGPEEFSELLSHVCPLKKTVKLRIETRMYSFAKIKDSRNGKRTTM